jgi:hypothetical protein
MQGAESEGGAVRVELNNLCKGQRVRVELNNLCKDDIHCTNSPDYP